MAKSARILSALVFAIAALFCSSGCRDADSARASGAMAPASTGTQAPQPEGSVRRQLLEIHAAYEVDVKSSASASSVAQQLGELARAKGGYVAQLRIGDNDTTHVTLRIPPSDLAALRALLADSGTVARQSEQAIDVTDAIADLDARLRSARIEESRILKLLEDKSGSIADVLAAERALADVRQRVEKLDAEARIAQARVDLATAEVMLRAPSAGASASVAQRLEAAAADGVTGAKAVLMGIATVALRTGPTLLVFCAIGASLYFLARRVRLAALKESPTTQSQARRPR